ncbi:hypothetical protein [Actinoallomurus iriomotensis]|uniref:Uncharacterized protein n=1 Tax=Actinoallomurus iriomotensis TaxID=478107 RepID=A0A9W6W5Z0_9ACTN|nr:hypothetical protein [Actinoallomurus iriomotensis]GLY92570.1 hypothetical protein Airi02_104980 [Actinoallomurus iriomotensis]
MNLLHLLVELGPDPVDPVLLDLAVGPGGALVHRTAFDELVEPSQRGLQHLPAGIERLDPGAIRIGACRSTR